MEQYRKALAEGVDAEDEYDEYDGVPLPENIVRLPMSVRRVHKVALGEAHMLVQCFDQRRQKDMVYAAGLNIWGQLGRDPIEQDFVTQLQPLSIQALDDDHKVKDYTICQIECGSHHSLLLVDCHMTVQTNDESRLSGLPASQMHSFHHDPSSLME